MIDPGTHSPGTSPSTENTASTVQKKEGERSQRLYAKRDKEALGDYYVRHVSAMTGEGLHWKSDIAAELAWRDRQIDELKRQLQSRSV